MDGEYIFMIGFICVLIIICIIVLQFALLLQSRKQIFNQQNELNQQRSTLMKMSDDMELLLTKIGEGVKYKINSSAISILDLAEFQNLDPFLKDQYKRHIVDMLAPALMEAINKTSRDNDLERYMIENDSQIRDSVYQLALAIKERGSAVGSNLLTSGPLNDTERAKAEESGDVYSYARKPEIYNVISYPPDLLQS